MEERALIIGAGISGLCTALALGPTGREVVVLERDERPPEGDADTAFRDWNRRGVGHLRQSHAFLARLRNIIKDDHPALLQELVDNGCRELGFEGMLSEQQKAVYVPKEVDKELTILTSRRTTLELIMRRYVERLPNVTIRSGFFVKELVLGAPVDGSLTVKGVRGEDGEEVLGDVTIDAGGKNSTILEQLIEAGANIPEETETAGILYFTRHYRLLPGQVEPPRGRLPSGGDLGYLKFGVFPADNGCFSITMAVPEVEMELRKAIMHPEIWDRVCNMLPGLVPWVNPQTSEIVSKVFGMGDLKSRWRDMVTDGKPAVLGFFALGDGLVRTNPLYGRGCSFAAVSGYMLKDVLNGSADPKARAIAFHKKMHDELRPYYLNMRDQDRGAIKRAYAALTPGHRQSLRGKLAQSFGEDGVAIAMRTDIELLRAAMRGFHMLEHPSAWLKKGQNMRKVLATWVKPKRAKADLYALRAGPGREEMIRALGLSPELDIERVKAEPQKMAA